jgi:hypothetical protein
MPSHKTLNACDISFPEPDPVKMGQWRRTLDNTPVGRHGIECFPMKVGVAPTVITRSTADAPVITAIRVKEEP